MTDWRRSLRELHDTYFGYDWDGHLRTLNERLGLSGPDAFGLPPGLPPSWLVGDVAALTPHAWVLVVALNQARREEEEWWHLEQNYTRQSYWDHWRFLNRNWWEPRYYRPLVRLASVALDRPVETHDEADFATNRMVFVELCPYPSRQFQLDASTVEALTEEDPGFRLAARVRDLLIEEASPALIMLNGFAAVDDFERLSHGRVALEERRYSSVSRPDRELRHWEGRYEAAAGPIPVIGFPFLRKPRTHNSYAEIEQLGFMARDLAAALSQNA